MNIVSFEYIEVDSGIAGDVKLVGDIDGDDNLDLVIAGMPSEKLNWYRYPDWQKTVIATPENEFTTDGALGDVDGDGDLDIVVPDGDSGENLLWFQNPLPNGDPGNGAQWIRHTIGSIGSWGKDVELADFDADGMLDVATRRDTEAMIFFQTGANTWTKTIFSDIQLGHEGMTSGDIDQDGNVDIVLQGVWLRNPSGSDSRDASRWTQYTIGDAPENFKALVVDLNLDDVTDVLFSSSEDTSDVNWWTPSSNDPTGTWKKQTIVPSLERAHTLQAADMDLDGDIDVVLGQMHTSIQQEIMVMYNTDGKATAWQKQVVDVGGMHNGVVADIGNDGDYDIFGANWTGNPPVKLYINHSESTGALDRWSYHQITDSHAQTFGLAFGDVDGDNELDIVSGPYWYRNPGGDLTGEWVQTILPEGMHAILTLNVDDDSHLDVIAQKDEGDIAIYWLETIDNLGNSWDSVRIGVVDKASHSLGAQGYRSAQIESTNKPEVIVSSGRGIYYFVIPDDPTSGNWPRVHISENPSDEGFAIGDMDRDGNPDVAATTGDSKRVEWYRNPGTRSDNWTSYHIGTFSEALFPDRTEVADLNNDGRLDIIVTEENGDDIDAQTYWWEAPTDATLSDWTSQLIVSQGTTNSMDVADMDQDGDVDVILAEHRGSKKMAIWLNDGSGNFTENVLSTGYESHLGAQTVDLDGDSDLDIVSIAWDSYNLMHLWRNDQQPDTSSTQNEDSTPVSTSSISQTFPTVESTPEIEALVSTPGSLDTEIQASPVVLNNLEDGTDPPDNDMSNFSEPADQIQVKNSNGRVTIIIGILIVFILGFVVLTAIKWGVRGKI